MKKNPALLLASTMLMACGAGPDVPVVAERFITALDPAMNIDSVATHPGTDGVTWLFATAKEGHVIRIYDAADGRHLRDLGGPGSAAGQFQRPNGILAADGMLIVIERDNRRVQLLNLPDLETLAVFGDAELDRPYGGYLQATGNDSYRLFVTDAYEAPDERVPPPAELDRRVREYSLSIERDPDGKVTAVSANHERAFGETEGPGMLHVVESIWGDPEHERLLIAEEDPAGGRVIKIYSFAGRYQDRQIGADIFRTQPEGIALFRCEDGSGYWITTDQDRGSNVFHLFDRQSLAHIGGFTGAVTRNTDGIWLMQEPIAEFPAGALFAVHDDQAVSALDWRDIAAALGIRADCRTG